MMNRLSLLGLVLLLAACGTPGLSTPAPTPEAITIFYPLSLQPWADKLSNCATETPLAALYFSPYSTNVPAATGKDIVLVFGQSGQSGNTVYLSQVGWEQVVVVVNQSNLLTRLSTDDLKSIFSGQETSLKNGDDLPIQVWVLPESEPARIIFDAALDLAQPLTTESMLAPDPKVMLEAVSQNTDALGYLPESVIKIADPSVASKVKVVQLDASIQADLRQPVIAMTQSEPKGLQRNILVCLQNSNP